MKFADIEIKFTVKVTQYLMNGYTIHARTMKGHQGEIAKIDLRRGNEVIRILLDRQFNHRKWNDESVVLIVGRVTDPSFDIDGYDIIWNNKLEVIERTEWVKLRSRKCGSEWYVSLEEAAKIEILKDVRANMKRVRKYRYDLDGKAAEIVLPFVRRQKGCKRCKPTDIKVYKYIDKCTTYYIEVNKREYTLK